MKFRDYILVGLFIIINSTYNAKFGLHYDEAYYWVWGQQLSLSYFDHSPAVAYLIRLFGVFGHSEFWVRLPAVLCLSITIITIYKLALRMFNANVASIALILAISMPVMEGSAFIITPDSPLIMFWALTLYFFYIGVFENKISAIYISGICAGFSMLSKYTGILIFPGIFLFLITSTKYRSVLLNKQIYVAFLLAFLIVSPVIIWNYQHDFVSLKYQFHHGISVSRFQISGVGDYLGGEIGFVSPVIFLAMFYYLIRYFKHNDERLNFLFYSLIFGFTFFLICSFTKHVEGNWPAPIYSALVILLAYYIDQYGSKWIYKVSFILICVVLLITKNPTWFVPKSMHNKVPGINILYGNKELLNKYLRPYLSSSPILLGCDYGNASRAWFYLSYHTYVLPELPFSNAYRFWPTPNLPINNAIYFCDSKNDEALKIMAKYFKHIDLIQVGVVSNLITDSYIYIYRVGN